MKNRLCAPEADGKQQEQGLNCLEARLRRIRRAAMVSTGARPAIQEEVLLGFPMSILCHRAVLMNGRKRMSEPRARRRTGGVRAVCRRCRQQAVYFMAMPSSNLLKRHGFCGVP